MILGFIIRRIQVAKQLKREKVFKFSGLCFGLSMFTFSTQRQMERDDLCECALKERLKDVVARLAMFNVE